MRPSVSIGNVYGHLRVMDRAESREPGRAYWSCLCTCGNTRVVPSKRLTTGADTACTMCQDSGAKAPLEARLRKWKLAENGCWLWTGKKNKLGYGSIQVNGKYSRAHREMYFLHNPGGSRSLVVMHKCDNPQCVNPEHLALGTVRDNMLDMHAKGRFRGGPPKGNQNAKGNKGWMKGGVTAKYAATKRTGGPA